MSNDEKVRTLKDKLCGWLIGAKKVSISDGRSIHGLELPVWILEMFTLLKHFGRFTPALLG